ncbi:hypothetical protein F5883DRAFT_140758 [Diaporthe sp. PMI_573]|nr:hypothetical protein F5883DRAFT_140758 [Diaporthaceae sp. PMI_573]
MWLIDTSTFRPREFTRSTPPYATLSHVTEEDEVSFESLENARRDLCNDNITIIERACGQARTAGVPWLWNYATCVDKRSCAAQSEAINSLAQVYRGCEYSIIYLADIVCELAGDATLGERLAGCRWIKNIWAIPQIIFSRAAYFFSSDWTQIGTKISLLPLLSSIIGIDQPVLEDSECLEDYSIARRMSWASQMTAPRPEDFAYALFGLFDVSMPIIYGEGPKAFLKFQEEIMRDTNDFSLLAWDNLSTQEYIGLFAPSPACFRRFRSGPATPLRVNGDVYIHCAGITMDISLWKSENGLFLPLLSDDGSICSIPLFQWDDCFVRMGSRVEWNLSGQVSADRARICVKRGVSAYVSRKISNDDGTVPEELFQSPKPLDDTSTARGTRCSNKDYNSKEGTCSIAPAEGTDCRGASQYASSVSSGVTPHEYPIAWPTHDRRAIEGTLSAIDSHTRASSAHDTTSEPHRVTEHSPIDDSGKDVFETSCRRSSGRDANDEPRNSILINGSPSAEVQVLDVASITKELADIAADRFLSRRPRKTNKRCFIPWNTQSRKRLKHSDSSDQLEGLYTSDSDDGETVLIKKTRSFACPFYVRNNQYTECVRRHHLSSIEDVKEHVCWDHRRPKFCPVCKEEFASGRNRDVHIRLRTCLANSSSAPDGITDNQEERLEREDRASMPEDSRWFQIWDIIYPNIARPSSTFYTSERELRVCAFRQLWMQSGEELVAAFLETKECQSYSIQNEERNLRTIYDLVEENVVDRIFDDFDDMTCKR